MLAALARADGLLGHPVPVAFGPAHPGRAGSALGPAAHQPLPGRPARHLRPRARAGRSTSRGAVADDLAAVAGLPGLCQPLPDTDPVHFIVVLGETAAVRCQVNDVVAG